MTSNLPTNHKNPFVNLIKKLFFFKKKKTHDLRKYQKGVDYSVDFIDSYNSARMITGISIRAGEYVVLTEREHTLKYLAETVDYYWNSDSLREIELKRILD